MRRDREKTAEEEKAIRLQNARDITDRTYKEIYQPRKRSKDQLPSDQEIGGQADLVKHQGQVLLDNQRQIQIVQQTPEIQDPGKKKRNKKKYGNIFDDKDLDKWHRDAQKRNPRQSIQKKILQVQQTDQNPPKSAKYGPDHDMTWRQYQDYAMKLIPFWNSLSFEEKVNFQFDNAEIQNQRRWWKFGRK